jgi:DNA polymerase-3 subunit gamma/tau
LLARALNCVEPVDGYEPCCRCKNCLAIAAGESLDVIEIDGASNNSVDEVRELKSHIMSVPMSSKYKIYIIDEVHMLSLSAFNALLKTLEEPPGHVVFILATTEARKVPVTIRSRCQHIPFHRIGTRTIYDRLSLVCSGESMKFQPEALWEIARQADGAMRDGLSMLEQVAGSGEETVTASDVETALGQGSRSSLERWLESWRRGDMKTFCELDRMLSGGASPQRFLEDLFSLVRNLWLVARWSDILETLDASAQEKEYLKREAPLWDPRNLGDVMRFLAELLPQTRMDLRIDVLSGLLMAKMSDLSAGSSRLPRLEEREETDPPPEVRERVGRPPAALERTTGGAGEISASAVSFSTAEPLGKALDGVTPCREDRWNEAMTALHERDFLLYCGLVDTRAFEDGERLVVDVPFRYSYEVLKLDRNRAGLRKILGRFWPAGVVVHHMGLSASCEGSPSPAPEDNPFPNFAERSGRSEPEKPEPSQSAGNIPFDGLVREVTRWMRGEVLLVRRGADDDMEDAAAEEQ